MKKIFTMILAIIAIASNVAHAQIPDASPYPVIFRMLEPASISGDYEYGTYVIGTAAGSLDWGDTLTQTVTGEVVWGFDATDSLCCGPIVNDVTGKIVLISRGICAFRQKVVNAQNAGAIGVIIMNRTANPTTGALEDANALFGMSADTTNNSEALLVNIPGIFVSLNTGNLMKAELNAGNPVMASYYVPKVYGASGFLSYQSPLSQTIPQTNLGVHYFNASTDVETGVTVKCDVITPSGIVESLETTQDIPALKDSVMQFNEAYIPTETGIYELVYSNNKSVDTLRTKYEITNYTYAVDNNVIDRGTAVDSASFAQNAYRFDVGALYFNGGGTVVTHASFALRNIESFHQDVFSAVLYDPVTDAGALVNPLNYTSMVTLTGGEVTIDTTVNKNDELILIELAEPFLMPKDSSAYALMIRYDGLVSATATGVVPNYAATAATEYLNIATLVCTYNSTGTPPIDYIYTGGWSGGTNNVTRLHLQGFVDGVNDGKPLKSTQVTLFPNPTSDVLNMQIELEGSSDADLRITDMMGRLISTQSIKDVSTGTYPINISALTNGTYFCTVTTKEGWRTKTFVVAK